MSKFSGRPVTINKPVGEVYDKISDIGAYQQKLDSLPEEARAKLGDVKFTDDSIIITAGPVGEICFKVVEKVPNTMIKLAAEQSPVPFGITVQTIADGDAATSVATELDVDIPAMLRPMVGGKLQEAADKFSELMKIFFA